MEVLTLLQSFKIHVWVRFNCDICECGSKQIVDAQNNVVDTMIQKERQDPNNFMTYEFPIRVIKFIIQCPYCDTIRTVDAQEDR